VLWGLVGVNKKSQEIKCDLKGYLSAHSHNLPNDASKVGESFSIKKSIDVNPLLDLNYRVAQFKNRKTNENIFKMFI
jgi:hypothetical protein